MVKQNLYKMKQPQLGQKIQEWRKAKGLTQEELVELCQINVRTIQRIEAGEVTPRSYTLKTIMEALHVDAAEIKMEEDTQPAPSGSSHPSDNYLRLAFFFGIIYLITSFIETFMDYTVWEESTYALSGVWYTVIKLVVVSTFTLFKYGFYSIGRDGKNPLISVTSILLIAGVFISVGKDLYMFFVMQELILEWMIADALYFGSVYIFFGIGLIRFQHLFGTLAWVAGGLGIITGLAFVSIVFALPGLFLLTLFEIFLLVILESSSRKLGRTKIADPNYSLSN